MPDSIALPSRSSGRQGGFPAGTARDGYALVVQLFEVDLAKLFDFTMFMTLHYGPEMMSRGFRLLVAGSHLTGTPGRAVHVWHQDLSVTPKPGLPALASAFSTYVRDEESFALRPTAYDPERWLPGLSKGAPPRPAGDAGLRASVGSRVYLIDTIQVRAGRMGEFVEGKRSLMIPLLSDPREGARAPWTLLAGGWLLGDDTPAAVNVWELPESDSLLNTMRRLSEDTEYQRFVGRCVQSEDQDLLAPGDFYEPRPVRAGDPRSPTVVYRG